MSHQQDFAQAMRQAGLTPPADIQADQWTRFPGIGHEHNRADTAGWCKLFADGRGGVYGDWRQGLCENWFDRQAHSQMSLAQRTELQTQTRTELENARKLHAQSQARAAARAQAIWDSSPQADDPITSCVIDPFPTRHRARQMPVPKGTNQKLVFKIASDLLQSSTHRGQGLASVMDRCIKLDDLIEACQSSLPIDPRRIPERVRESVKAMVANGVLMFQEGWIWLA